jgi:hypothetical protein
MITKSGESAQKGKPTLGLVVAFSGKAKSGKDTATDILVSEFGFKQFAFADALKQYAMQYFGLKREEVYEKKTAFSRNILQGLGTFTRKEIRESFWTDLLGENVKLHMRLNRAARIVISDVRTTHEAQLVSSLGGHLVRVTRPEGLKIECGLDHISEVELDSYSSWDCEICNNSDIESYRSKVRNMVMQFL